MKIAPSTYVQTDGQASESCVSANRMISVPMTGPSKVLLPPITTPASIMMDGITSMSEGEMMPTTGTNMAPPMPANTAARENVNTLMEAGLYPRNFMRFSWSRTPMMSSPMNE